MYETVGDLLGRLGSEMYKLCQKHIYFIILYRQCMSVNQNTASSCIVVIDHQSCLTWTNVHIIVDIALSLLCMQRPIIIYSVTVVGVYIYLNVIYMWNCQYLSVSKALMRDIGNVVVKRTCWPVAGHWLVLHMVSWKSAHRLTWNLSKTRTIQLHSGTQA